MNSLPPGPNGGLPLPSPTLGDVEIPRNFVAPASPEPPAVTLLSGLPFSPVSLKEWRGAVWDAIRYPMRGAGWLILLPGVVFACFTLFPCVYFGTTFLFPLDFGRPLTQMAIGSMSHSLLQPQGLFVLLLFVLLPLVYFAACFLRVVEAVLAGKEKPPAWPAAYVEFADWIPSITVLAVGAMSCLPVFAYYVMFGTQEHPPVGALLADWVGAVCLVLALLGFIAQDFMWREIPVGMLQALRLPWTAWAIPATLLFTFRFLVWSMEEDFWDSFIGGGGGWPVMAGSVQCLLFVWSVPIFGKLIGWTYLRHQRLFDEQD